MLFVSVGSAAGIDYESSTLKNGVRLIYRILPDADTVAARFVVPAGFINETKEEMGISHLLEHLIYRGNEQYSSEEFHKRIDDIGGTYNGGTWLEMTDFHMEVPKDHFMEAFTLYLDLILNPGLRVEDIEMEKKIVSVEKAIRKSPGSATWIYLNEMTDQKYDYDVSKINQGMLADYHKRFYHLNRMTIIVTGSFDQKEIKKHLSSLPVDKSGEEWFSDTIYEPKPEIVTEDYLQGEKYKLLYSFDLGGLKGQDLLVAKILPYILEYETRQYDNLTDRALDYGIGLLNYSGRFYLVFTYRDPHEEYDLKMIEWHEKNLRRYCMYLKTKKLDKFLKNMTDAMSRSYQALQYDPLSLNEYYFSSLFDPTQITQEEHSRIANLTSRDFKRFVEKNLEGNTPQKIVIHAK
jgi:predicted Zn-dependent peptidase